MIMKWEPEPLDGYEEPELIVIDGVIVVVRVKANG